MTRILNSRNPDDVAVILAWEKMEVPFQYRQSDKDNWATWRKEINTSVIIDGKDSYPYFEYRPHPGL